MKKILFSAHDAGGANAIAPVIMALNAQGHAVEGLVHGPARAIFSAHGFAYREAEALSDDDVKFIRTFAPDIFVAGTSAGRTIDKDILMLISDETPSVYVLDFWSNYWQRFSDNSKDFKFLPSIICVMDEHAKSEMTREGFPPSHIRVTGNPHFDDLGRSITRDREDRHKMLFVSQPISTLGQHEHYTQYGFDEFDALRDILECMQDMPAAYILYLRLHPKENADKYSTYESHRVKTSTAVTVEGAISDSGLVIGMFSPVLLQAAAVGKPVISYEPNITVPDPLPTNSLGITYGAKNKQKLCELLELYAKGNLRDTPASDSKLFHGRATDSVIAVIADLLA